MKKSSHIRLEEISSVNIKAVLAVVIINLHFCWFILPFSTLPSPVTDCTYHYHNISPAEDKNDKYSSHLAWQYNLQLTGPSFFTELWHHEALYWTLLLLSSVLCIILRQTIMNSKTKCGNTSQNIWLSLCKLSDLSNFI